ncbi:SDR family NAD(P)-dependent oxidoreductase [Streptomyces fuscigenes]|uniref:SDR family NAD(P)-dependent oxidoreductase n=1 Tax=Streptomyces fuscigenes TaxID=1528880 RepID=UPI001F166B66|nr:SDR family oxidoreductase [Streptomyces fuscigenes]MCF3961330.1 SDR family oxidoreductase [Streptomyces fuscigenes]
MGTLDGKVCVVTGATSGIGARTAGVLAAEGARVVVASRRTEEGEALARSIGSTAVFHCADMCVEAEVEALVDRAVETFGRLDVLVNDTGSPSHLTSVMDMDPSLLEATFSVHVTGTLLGIKHAARAMRGTGGGSIVTMSGVAGHAGGWAGIDYSVAKAAVAHLTRCAAVELGEYGIRVNSVSPGPMLTGAFGAAAEDADGRVEVLRHVMADMRREQQPLDAVGGTDDPALATLFLASDASRMITGQDLVVDGGLLAGRPAPVLMRERSRIAAIVAGDGPAEA